MVNIRTDFTDLIDLYNNLSINAILPQQSIGLNSNIIDDNGNALLSTFFIEDSTSYSPRYGHLNNEAVSIKYLSRDQSLIYYYEEIVPDVGTSYFTLQGMTKYTAWYDATFLVQADDVAVVYLLQDATDQIVLDGTDYNVIHYDTYSKFYIDNTSTLIFRISSIETLVKPLLFYSNPANYSHFNIVNVLQTYGVSGIWKNIWIYSYIMKFNLTNFISYSKQYYHNIMSGMGNILGAGQIGDNVILFDNKDNIYRYNAVTQVAYKFSNKYMISTQEVQGETHNSDKFLFFNSFSLNEIKDTGVSYITAHPGGQTSWEDAGVTEDYTHLIHFVNGPHDVFTYETKAFVTKDVPPFTAVYKRLLETQDAANLLYHDRTTGQSTYYFYNYIILANTWTIKFSSPLWFCAVTPVDDEKAYLSNIVSGDAYEYELDFNTNTRTLKMGNDVGNITPLGTYHNGLTFESDLVEHKFK